MTIHFSILAWKIPWTEDPDRLQSMWSHKVRRDWVTNAFKKTKELYTENSKTLMKEIKDDINRWRNIPCSWVGRINIVKVTIPPNATYRFNVIPTDAFFTEPWQKISHFTWKHKRLQITKAVLRKKNGAGGINLADFRLYYKVTIIRTEWYWH